MNQPPQINPNAIQLAFCVDDNFCQHLSALIVSIQRHTKHSINAHIISSGLSEMNKKKLLVMQNASFVIHFHLIDNHGFTALPISLRYSERLSCATYYRMALPQLLPETVEKVLYLDADMLVIDDIAALWEIDVKNVAAGVVEDASLSQQRRWEELNTPLPYYFNAGMMLMNLAIWRNEKLAEKTFSYLETGKKWDYNDQDLLNLALNGNVEFVSGHWNVQTYSFANQKVIKPKIVHFTGVEKPWHLSSSHPYKSEYESCRKNSSYADYKPEMYLDLHDKKIVSQIKSCIKKPTKIVIYGAGQRGRRLFHALASDNNLAINCFVDQRITESYEGIPVKNKIGPQDMDYVILSSMAFAQQIMRQLSLWGISEDKVIRGEINV